jgi:hypothetical protein
MGNTRLSPFPGEEESVEGCLSGGDLDPGIKFPRRLGVPSSVGNYHNYYGLVNFDELVKSHF